MAVSKGMEHVPVNYISDNIQYAFYLAVVAF